MDFLALFCLFALIFVSRITLVNDHDVFMHIRAGQWILENRAIPRSDPFSYSAAGAPWDDHEWLFQVFSRFLFQAGGLVAVGLARAVILTAALFLLYRLCRMRGAGRGLAGVLTLAASIGVWPFNEPRPYIVTPLGLALFALALEHIRRGARRWIFLPPLVMALWVNMHAGFTSGCIILVIAFCGAVVEEMVRAARARFGGREIAPAASKTGSSKAGAATISAVSKARRAPRSPRASLRKERKPGARPAGVGVNNVLDNHVFRLFCCGVLTFLALLMNPYGWRILVFPFKLVSHPLLMRIIQEWNPSALGKDSALFYALAFILGIRALGLGLRARPADVAALVVFTLMALSARRHVSLFFFVLTPVAAEWFASLMIEGRKAGERRQTGEGPKAGDSSRTTESASAAARRMPCAIRSVLRAPRAVRRAAAWALLLALTAALVVPTLRYSRIRRFGFGPNPEIFPTRAADLVLQYRLKPRMFNGYNFGGYLIYRLFPQYEVFIDGRADVYGPTINQQFADIFYAREGWREQLDAMGANFVLVDPPLADRRNLIDALVESPDWTLVYWDDTASLFVRNIPEHQQIIRERAFRHIHPLKTDESLARRWNTPEARVAGLRELERRAREGPPSYGVLRNLSFVYGRQGRHREALRAVEAYLRMLPDDVTMIVRKAQIYEQMGRPEEARRCYLSALRRRGDYAYVITRLGVLAQARGDWRAAEKYYRRSYEADPPDAVGTLQYAGALMHRKAWAQATAAVRDYLAAQKPGSQLDPKSWEMLASCYEQTGQPFRARQARARQDEGR